MPLHILLCDEVLLYFILRIGVIWSSNLTWIQMNLQSYIQFQKWKEFFPLVRQVGQKLFLLCLGPPGQSISLSQTPAYHLPLCLRVKPSIGPPDHLPPHVTHVGSVLVPCSSWQRNFSVSILSQDLAFGFDFEIRSLGDWVGYEIGTSSPIKGAFPYRFCQNPVWHPSRCSTSSPSHYTPPRARPRLLHARGGVGATVCHNPDAGGSPDQASTIVGTRSRDPPIASYFPVIPPSCKLHRWVLCVMPPP
jgi:hypothetical protein